MNFFVSVPSLFLIIVSACLVAILAAPLVDSQTLHSPLADIEENGDPFERKIQPSQLSDSAENRSTASQPLQTSPLLTSWGAELTPDNVHHEYPRPTLFRPEWLNLNGNWSWKEESEKDFTREILVPFSVESPLSGVMRQSERSVYRRTFTIPQDWDGESRILLHFGAVDWEAAVFINGQQVGIHRGGYDSFSFDITPLIHRNEPNELIVHVFDPTQQGEQPRGRQSTHPSNIWYTASTGIWQTVWIEPVPQNYITSLKILTDSDTGHVTIIPHVNMPQDQADGKNLMIAAEAFDGEKIIAKAYGGSGGSLLMRLEKEEIKKWSPENPHLYQIRLQLFERETEVDAVGSYFAFRKIETVENSAGYPVLYLNGERLFQMGVIDQGYWPDGLYTPPADGAQRLDIQVIKAMGFNTIRKYQKIEPERWYFWCDRLGILVWQDMPSGENRSPADQQQFREELKRMIQTRGQHPSIVTWTIFNEGAGQHNVAEYIDFVRQLDPTRLINGTSGWTDYQLGDFNVSHKFPGPEMPSPDLRRAAVIGSFGGLTLIPPPEHRSPQTPWGHLHVSDSDSFIERYKQMHEELRRNIQTQGLTAAFFHQLTDIESECDGLMTYDRTSLKVQEGVLKEINRETIRIGSEP